MKLILKSFMLGFDLEPKLCSQSFLYPSLLSGPTVGWMVPTHKAEDGPSLFSLLTSMLISFQKHSVSHSQWSCSASSADSPNGCTKLTNPEL